MVKVYQTITESERQKIKRQVEAEELVRQANRKGLSLMTAEQLRQQIIVEAVRRDFGGAS